MELIYLWVEDYKNIKKQGFNFSPRFDCEYDNITGELTIIENKNYKSIFPDNINITAIVGENGSGKSNLLEKIEILSKLKLNLENDIAIFKNFSNSKEELLYYSKKDMNIDNVKSLNIREIQRVFIKNNTSSEIIFNDEYFELLLRDKAIDYHFLNKIFFDSCKVKLNFKRENEDYTVINDISKNQDISYSFEFLLNEIIHTFGGSLTIDKKDIQSFLKENIDKRTSNFFSKEEHQNFIKEQKENIEKKKPYFFSSEDYKELFKLFFEFNENELETIYKHLGKVYTKENIKDLSQLINNNDFLKYLKEENIIKYNFYDSSTKIHYENLSDGEKKFLGFFTHLISKIKHETNTNNFILLDEPDIFLHPNWQKKFIKNLIEFFNKNYPNKTLHIFITSHSPFILSDIPKENIIFLDKYKETDKEVKENLQKIGNCKNVSKDIEINQTFGANIHTLLSHGFFMNDGLMGEFAKDKINEIKKFYELIQKLQNNHKIKIELWEKSYKRRKKRFYTIQKIIGEPFLKTIIKNYLDELDILFYGKKEFLDNEIKRLEELRENLDD